MKIKDLKETTREPKKFWEITLPVVIFGYVAIRDKSANDDISVLVDGIKMEYFKKLHVMREVGGDKQVLMIVGSIRVYGKSLKSAMRDVEKSSVEVLGEKWSGFMSGLSIDVVGPAIMNEVVV